MLPCVSALPSLCNGTIDIPQRAVSSKQSFHPIMFLSRDCRFMSFANLVCLVLSRLYPFSMCCLRVMVFIWSVLKRDSFLWPPNASISFISLRSFPNGCKRLGSLSFPPFDSFVFEITSSLFPRIESTSCFHFHSHFSKSLPISLISLQSLPLLCLIHFYRNQRVSFLWISVDICGFFRTFMHSNGFVGSLGIV